MALLLCTCTSQTTGKRPEMSCVEKTKGNAMSNRTGQSMACILAGGKAEKCRCNFPLKEKVLSLSFTLQHNRLVQTSRKRSLENSWGSISQVGGSSTNTTLHRHFKAFSIRMTIKAGVRGGSNLVGQHAGNMAFNTLSPGWAGLAPEAHGQAFSPKLPLFQGQCSLSVQAAPTFGSV